MADDSLPDRLEPANVQQQRKLTSEEREVLHRVIGMLEDKPEYADMAGPGLRAAIGDGTQPQQRDLMAQERAGLGGVIRRPPGMAAHLRA